jgi:5'-deoxy-5'-methylthioadenosine phosphorylase
MPQIAIIGGTGLTSLKGLKITHKEVVHTPYGEPSGPLIFGDLFDREVVFLARHGAGHTIPPHQINYRANIKALKQCDVKQVIGVAAVGGIDAQAAPGMLVIPDQIIDYTWGRENTFFEEKLSAVTHIDFSYPYSTVLRQLLIESAQDAGVAAVDGGVYGATQGPRLETAAEILRMERDGCTIVGMTGMPEAALARELGMDYACCAVVANWAAGKDEGHEISMTEIEQNLVSGMERVRHVLEKIVPHCISNGN